MKQSAKLIAIKSFLLFLFLNAFQLTLLAQDSGDKSSTTTTSKTDIKVTSDSTTTEWYTSPWVWIIGAAVFILILVALLSNRGGDRTVASTSDRVTVKKTVERDNDTSA